MTTEKPFDTIQLLRDLNGGRFLDQLDAVLTEVGSHTATFGDSKNKGQIIITMNLARVDDTRQLKTDVKLAFKRPNPNDGQIAGFFKFGTRLFARLNGALSFLKEAEQEDAFTPKEKA